MGVASAGGRGLGAERSRAEQLCWLLIVLCLGLHVLSAEGRDQVGHAGGRVITVMVDRELGVK